MALRYSLWVTDSHLSYNAIEDGATKMVPGQLLIRGKFTKLNFGAMNYNIMG